MSDVRPFEEYKEMIKDMSKEEMIKGLYDLSARVTKQENIIKEVRKYIEDYINQFNGVYPVADMRYLDLNNIFEILDKEKV